MIRLEAVAVLAAALALAAATVQGGETPVLSDVRQLTFAGKRAGEGYFSADGQRMIFQSERQPGNPFYQMYLLDLWSGEVERLSPGHGKTTCGWLHPSGRKAMFSSTHDDPEARAKQRAELDFRASGKERRYSWDFDQHYEIYEIDLETRTTVNLTNAPGYDAEGSYSPDGRLIAFASNRHAYGGTLSAEQAAVFERDESTMMDIYIMNADGSNVRRLTEAPGYDGGPFFSADGTRIVWRRFAEDGATAEVFTMNLEGGDQKQITRLGVMSWAPFFHPSGDYIVFTTNLHGFANFELYAVDSEGLGEPVRITDSKGFDGLAAFSPDGRTLAWTRRRSSDGFAQIFTGDWNDAEIRSRLGLAPGAVIAARRAPPAKVAPIEAAAVRRHVARLASVEMAGRLTGSPGARRAGDYIAGVFAELGLEPAGDNGTYFQAFTYTAGATLGPGNRLSLHISNAHQAPELDRDWRPLAFSGSGTLQSAEVAFAGYGIVAPAAGDMAAYDSYGELDVAGKWVVVFRYLPEDAGPEARSHLLPYTDLQYKAAVARRRGAAGLIVVSGPNSGVKEQLVELSSEVGGGLAAIPALSIGDALAQRLLGKDLKRLQDELDSGAAVAGFAVPGATLGADIDIARESRTGRNVLARLKATSPEATGGLAVVLGAHYDHLGRGEAGGSLGGNEERGKIHYGADDNASGVAGLLEIARRLSTLCGCPANRTTRDILFAAWSGEELGVLGSTHFAKRPEGAAAAYLNMDMIGRLKDRLYLQGTGSSPAWPGLIESAAAPLGLAVATSPDSYLPTDSTPFYLAGVPVLNAFTGAHTDYSSTRDTADRVDHAGVARIADLMARLTLAVARLEQPPAYVRQERPKGSVGRKHLRVYLGTIPDYTQSDGKGVRLSGTAKGGPAEAAGLKGGDVIVGMAGADIANIYDFVAALGGLKAGQPVDITVIRDDAETTLTITPAARE